MTEVAVWNDDGRRGDVLTGFSAAPNADILVLIDGRGASLLLLEVSLVNICDDNVSQLARPTSWIEGGSVRTMNASVALRII